jgi:LysR family transcriptional regulator, hydrogen peroxide-inducible genes activator
MNLRDLQYLSEVARHLHFGKAAQVCNVSQPTLSMQLKKLEEYLGVQLFERTNKQVLLTSIGEAMVVRARRILEEANDMRTHARAATDPFSGTLRMGIFPTLAPYVLPRLMPALRAAFPQLNVLLVEEKTPLLVEQLAQGALDVALLAMPVVQAEFSHHALFIEPFMLAVPRDHKLARRKEVSLQDIRDEVMLLLDEGHCLRDQALEVCHAIGNEESQHFRATSLETLRHMVASGSAVTLMPKLAVRSDDPHVAYVPFREPAPSRTIGLYWRSTSARIKLFDKIQGLKW